MVWLPLPPLSPPQSKNCKKVTEEEERGREWGRGQCNLFLEYNIQVLTIETTVRKP